MCRVGKNPKSGLGLFHYPSPTFNKYPANTRSPIQYHFLNLLNFVYFCQNSKHFGYFFEMFGYFAPKFWRVPTTQHKEPGRVPGSATREPDFLLPDTSLVHTDQCWMLIETSKKQHGHEWPKNVQTDYHHSSWIIRKAIHFSHAWCIHNAYLKVYHYTEN